jgi:hypothetical protein
MLSSLSRNIGSSAASLSRILRCRVEEVRNSSGTQFDPLVAEAFLDLIYQGVISE